MSSMRIEVYDERESWRIKFYERAIIFAKDPFASSSCRVFSFRCIKLGEELGAMSESQLPRRRFVRR